VDEILFKTYLQLKTAQSDPSPRQQISEEQMASLVAFFAAVDPTTHDVVECLKKMARPAIVPTACKVRLAKRFGFEAGHLKYMLSSLPGETFEALEEEFHKRFGDRQAVGPWQRAVRHIYKGYEVLKTPVQFTAIRVGSDLRDSVMEAVDPLPRPPLVVVAATWPELAAQIDEMALLDTVGQSATQDLTDLARASLSLSATLTTLNATLTKQQATLNMLLEARGELNAVYRSTSWTVTYPLRVAGASIRRLVRRIPIRR
jgi:hypothetical protein